MSNKRYKDIFLQFVHRGQPTPFTLGTLAVCMLCFVIVIVSVFTQINFYHPTFSGTKEVSYCPVIPVLFFILYILGKNYSLFVFILYCLCGLFLWPVFAFGGGIEYTKDYFFGYLLGYLFAIFVAGRILDKDLSIKSRIIAILYGILTIHVSGFIYCVFLAFFGKIDYSLIFPIVKVFSIEKLGYDIIFSIVALLIAPYIKNILWICMQRAFTKKESKNSRERSQISSNNIN